jgi:hypothetical protein
VLIGGAAGMLAFGIAAGVVWGQAKAGYESAVDVYNDSLALRLGIADADGAYRPPEGVLVDEEGFIILDQRELSAPELRPKPPAPAEPKPPAPVEPEPNSDGPAQPEAEDAGSSSQVEGGEGTASPEPGSGSGSSPQNEAKDANDAGEAGGGAGETASLEPGRATGLVGPSRF